MKKLWITKYALTDGKIKEVEWDGEMYDHRYAVVPGGYNTLYRVGRDAHVTLASAVAAAHRDRLKKIASLKKQIEKLEKMTF